MRLLQHGREDPLHNEAFFQGSDNVGNSSPASYSNGIVSVCPTYVTERL